MIPEMPHDLGWVYVDGIRANFDGHGICAEDDYFRDIAESLEIQKDINGAFHPNAAGHYFGYAPAITESARYALGFPYPGALHPPGTPAPTPPRCATPSSATATTS